MSRQSRAATYSRGNVADRTAEIYAEMAAAEGREAIAVGYMIKQGNMFKSWKRRYFAIQGATVGWYESPETYAAGTTLGEIEAVSMTESQDSSVIHYTAPAPTHSPSPGATHSFCP